MFFVDIIREFFPKTTIKLKSSSDFTPEQKYLQKYTPFEAEFYIWPQIQLHQTAESLFGQSIEMDSTIDKLQDKLKEYNFYESVIKHINHEIASDKKQKQNQEKIDFIRYYNPSSNQDREKVAKDIFKLLPLGKKMDLLDEKITLLKNYSSRIAEN
jgi:hypothetical protein